MCPPDDLGLKEFRSEPEDEGLSLEKLSAAFAQMTGKHDPYRPVAEKSLTPAIDVAASATGTAARVEVTPRSILEAMLFVGHPQNEPITAERVASLMRGVRTTEIDELVVELNQHYQASQCPYAIKSVGAGYRLELLEDFGPIRDRALGRDRASKLSPAALEVLSLVAYNEPQTAEEISLARGRPCGQLLAQLVRLGLLRMDRAKEQGGVIRRYYTTPRFLALFQLDSLEDLPRDEDLEKR